MAVQPLFNRQALIDAGMDLPLVEKVESAYSVMRRLFATDRLVSVAWSGGKDSTVCLILAILAYCDAVAAEGRKLPLMVTTADTGIENPAVHRYWLDMGRAVIAYARAASLDIRVQVAEPTIISSWAVKIVSGCGLPTFTNSKSRKCSIDLKRTPANRLLRRLVPDLVSELDKELDRAPTDFLRLHQMRQALAELKPVVVVGTRYGESEVRDRNMKARGDVAGEIRENEDGLLVLPLIASFQLEDVWEVLALSGQGPAYPLPSFAKNFDLTRDIYRDATGECVIVSSGRDNKAACGARFGCWACTAVHQDRSMETMLEQPQYAYMRPLNQLRNYLVATQNDLDLRRWVGRTFHPVTGHVKVQPDGYSSQMCEDLLGMMLTIDVRERERAERLADAYQSYMDGDREVEWPDAYVQQCADEGKLDWAYISRMVEPQFCTVTEKDLLAIDFLWARYAVHKPFRALWIWREVMDRGRRFEVPHVAEKAPSNFPALRWLPVPENPFRHNPLFDELEWSLRDRPGVTLPSITDDTTTVDANEDEAITVYDESTVFIMDFERDGLLSLYHDGRFHPTVAVQFYLRYGAIGIPKGRINEVGAVARRNLRLIDAGYHPALPLHALPMNLSISDQEHNALIKQLGGGKVDEIPPRGKGGERGRGQDQLDLFGQVAAA